MPNLILTSVRPCIKCGATERYKGGACKACTRATKAIWRVANIDKAKTTFSAWYSANIDHIRATGKAWRAANTDRDKKNSAAWYAANSDRVKATCSAWNAANTDKRRSIMAAWYSANFEELKIKRKAYRVANPDVGRVHNQNRRAHKQSANGKLSIGLDKKLFKLQKGKCPCCGQPLGDDYHMDHKMPLALGGIHADENMQLLRAKCNMQKHAKHPVDFMQERGFLL